MSASDNDSDWSDIAEDGEVILDNDESLIKAHCLFCPHCDVDVDKIFSHMSSEHHIVMKDIILKFNFDLYNYFKFINYVRKSRCTPENINNVKPEMFSSDDWLKPVLEDDLLLQYDIEGLCLNESDTSSEVESLRLKLGVSEERAKLAEEFLERTIDDLNKCRRELNNLLLGGGSSSGCDKGSKNPSKNVNGHIPMDLDDHEGYFSSYAHYGIHEEMLKDKVRTGAYRSFILNNAGLFKDSRVLDVGCGTSVLSMFASQAGAKEVISVDNSEVAYQAMDIVLENQLTQCIKVQKGKAEDMDIKGKVDIIISEWMGYFLLFESMLDTVIFCRDNYLSESGCLYPDKCNISLLALDDSDLYNNKVNFWNDVYGFKMSAMKRSVIEEPLIAVVSPEKVISKPYILKRFDLMKTTVSDLEFDEPFSLSIQRDGTISALVGYFDIDFERNAEHHVRFSTNPSETATHWKQTVFFFREPMLVKLNDCVKGRLRCRKNKKDTRSLDITVDIYKDDVVVYHQLYCML